MYSGAAENRGLGGGTQSYKGDFDNVKKYDSETFDELRKQHSIMIWVGNRFNVAILN